MLALRGYGLRVRTDRQPVTQPVVLRGLGLLAVVLGLLLMHGLTVSGGCHASAVMMSDQITPMSASAIAHPAGAITGPTFSGQQMTGAACVTRAEPDQHFPAPVLLAVVFALGGGSISWNRPGLTRRRGRQRAPTGRQLLQRLQISRT